MQNSIIAPSLNGKEFIGELSEIVSLFVSATATDVKTFRLRVQEALQEAGHAIPLQDDLLDGAVDVVTLCRDWLHQCDAYIGIYGFRYGWIPNAETESITHLECKWALARWPADQPCPLFIFLPEKDSEAQNFLDDQADARLREDFPDTSEGEEKRKQDRRKQEEFLSWVRGCGRKIHFYRDKAQLCSRALNVINHWNQKALRGAINERKSGGIDELPVSLLGAIDRETQLEMLVEILEAMQTRRDLSGACLMVCGRNGTGHYEFLEFLKEWFVDEWDGWQRESQVHQVIRDEPRRDVTTLLRTVFSQLAPTDQPEGELAEEVARALLSRCREQPQVLLISDVDRIEGGIGAFHKNVWAPVFASMQAARQPQIHKHQAVIVVTACESPAEAGQDDVWGNSDDLDAIDYRRLVPLPELGSFSKKDVSNWLNGRAVADWLEPAGRRTLGAGDRKALAESVIARGREPRLVFEELRKTRIWAGDNQGT